MDPRLLRYYEQQGLLRPGRQTNGYREYEESDIATVAWIRRLLGAGLTTATIAELRGCVQRDVSHDPANCQLLAARLSQERERIDAAIAELAATRAALDEVITAAEPAWQDGAQLSRERRTGRDVEARRTSTSSAQAWQTMAREGGG